MHQKYTVLDGADSGPEGDYTDKVRIPADSDLITGDTVRGSLELRGWTSQSSHIQWHTCGSGLKGDAEREHPLELRMHEKVGSKALGHRVLGYRPEEVRFPADSDLITGDTVRGSSVSGCRILGC
jgi:hypothetical protein